MAARDFEDLLLVWSRSAVLPQFSWLYSVPSLFSTSSYPSHTIHPTLLFLLCHWHGLAKLRMHTDNTLEVMESVTVRLANHLRTFTNETCTAVSTKELRHEVQARTRRQGREALLRQGTLSSQQNSAHTATRKVKTLNLQTYKLHALGDYVEQIRTYGTTDSYSTQPVSYQGSLLILLILILSDFPGRTWASCRKK